MSNTREKTLKLIGESLKKIRLQNGVSTYTLEKKHNIRHSQMTSIESGESVTTNKLVDYMTAIGIDFDDLSKKLKSCY